MFDVNLSNAKTKRIATHLDPQRNPTDLVSLIGEGRWDLDGGLSLLDLRDMNSGQYIP